MSPDTPLPSSTDILTCPSCRAELAPRLLCLSVLPPPGPCRRTQSAGPGGRRGGAGGRPFCRPGRLAASGHPLAPRHPPAPGDPPADRRPGKSGGLEPPTPGPALSLRDRRVPGRRPRPCIDRRLVGREEGHGRCRNTRPGRLEVQVPGVHGPGQGQAASCWD